jgi:signal transduction histidine kinase
LHAVFHSLFATAMTTTLLKNVKGSATLEAAGKALRDAGVGVVEVEDWRDAAEVLNKYEAALVVCDGDLESGGASRIAKALASLAENDASLIAPDARRALSHELRTPLSAMAGWVHLIESGKLDEAGLKRAATRLRGNIDDQVRVIERHLGATNQEGRS